MSVYVTDHAVLRYMERVQGFNVEAVRAHIAAQCGPAVRAGASTLKAEGMRFAFANGAVTTVTPDSATPSRTHTRRLGLKAPK